MITEQHRSDVELIIKRGMLESVFDLTYNALQSLQHGALAHLNIENVLFLKGPPGWGVGRGANDTTL
jgi:hypothetical protein